MRNNKSKINILVVDDDRQIADMLTEYLNAKKNNQATAAYGGREAFERFKKGAFQIVITDLKLPEMDGMELMETIKAIDSQVVVIVISGYGTIKSAVNAIRKGAYDFIAKPLELNQVQLVIDRAIENITLRKQLGIFRGLSLAFLVSIPAWLILGIVLALLW